MALAAGKLDAATTCPNCARQLAEEYPSQEPRMNRELIRVLAYLQDPTAAERVVEQLESDAPTIERLHAALLRRFLTTGWTTPRKLAMLQVLRRGPHHARRTQLLPATSKTSRAISLPA